MFKKNEIYLNGYCRQANKIEVIMDGQTGSETDGLACTQLKSCSGTDILPSSSANLPYGSIYQPALY